MIEVRIKYTEQDEATATSIGEMTLAEAREFFEHFSYKNVTTRHAVDVKGPLRGSCQGERYVFLNFLPVIHNDEEDDGEGGPKVYGFLHSTLVLPNPNTGETNKPYLLLEYMEVTP